LNGVEVSNRLIYDDKNLICPEPVLTRSIFAFLFILIVSVVPSTAVLAASISTSRDYSTEPDKLYLGLDMGSFYFTGLGTHTLAPLLGMRVGYELPGKGIGDILDIEMAINYFRSKPKTATSEINGYLAHIDAVLPLATGEGLIPSVAVGFGGLMVGDTAHTSGRPLFNYGAGLKYQLNSKWALRADARHILAFAIKGADNFELSAGLNYYFDLVNKKEPVPPQEEKPVEKAPKEKDKFKSQKEPPSPPPPAEKTGSGAAPEAPPAQKQEKPSPAPPGTALEGGCYYTLAAQGIVNRKQLEPLLNKLKAAGRQTTVREETRETEVYRLSSDCYKDMKSALKKQAQLDRKHRNSFVIPDGNEWCVIVGSYLTETTAQEEQQKFAAKRFPVKIVKARVSLPIWRITSGRYADMRQAEEAAKILAELGIDTSVVKVCRGTADPDGQILVSELTLEFDFDRYDVKPKYVPQIKAIADTLKSSPASTAVIEGHTDIVGTRRYNLKLSQRRAQSVKNVLTRFGIDPKRISIKGFGPSRPVADNETVKGRRKNRRAVEIVIVNH
jgi:outer membrane protein OmpA-like peptidoglycan-associated protein